MKLRYWMAFAAVSLLSPGLPFLAAHAETACESKSVLDYLPPLPRGCQKQRISATGGMTYGVVLSAGGRAKRAWRRQVLFFFGERYLDWEKAACKKVLCVRATFAGSRRCTYSAFPCASDADPEALAALSTRQIAPEEVRSRQPFAASKTGEPKLTAREVRGSQPSTAPKIEEPHTAMMEARGSEALTASEIEELQGLLSKAGYRVWIDGVPGDQTERALARWQRRRGLAHSAPLSRASLEMLRHAYTAGAGTHSR